mmetsp:Transcript_25573/g.29266  ORF Transcript_25573/g.29266 Transcript_25573/m.29266 type:complete len:373 (+) Transcript_25573:87-1205(+)
MATSTESAESKSIKMGEEYGEKAVVQQSATSRALGERIMYNLVMKRINDNREDFDGSSSFRMAEFGSADGTNSFDLIKDVIRAVREVDAEKPIEILCNDLPSANFGELFKTLKPLEAEFKNVHIMVAGDSFYRQVFAKNSIDIAFSFTSIHWLSKVPCFMESRYYVPFGLECADQERKALWEEQGRVDWRTFLAAREKELKKGGLLYVTTLGFTDAPEDTDHLHASVNICLMEKMVNVLEKNNLGEFKHQFNFPVMHRQEKHYREAFEGDSPVEGLELYDYSNYKVEGGVLNTIAQQGDLEAMIKAIAGVNKVGCTPYYKGRLGLIESLTPEDRDRVLAEIEATWIPTLKEVVTLEFAKTLSPFNELFIRKV